MKNDQPKAGLPNLKPSIIWMINFGFLGVQMAFTLQSSQMSRIFQTIGANPNDLGWFFILPPLGWFSCSTISRLLLRPDMGTETRWTAASVPSFRNDRCCYRYVLVTKLRKFRIRLRFNGRNVLCRNYRCLS